VSLLLEGSQILHTYSTKHSKSTDWRHTVKYYITIAYSQRHSQPIYCPARVSYCRPSSKILLKSGVPSGTVLCPQTEVQKADF